MMENTITPLFYGQSMVQPFVAQAADPLEIRWNFWKKNNNLAVKSRSVQPSNEMILPWWKQSKPHFWPIVLKLCFTMRNCDACFLTASLDTFLTHYYCEWVVETTSGLIYRARSEWVKNLPSLAQCRKQIRKRLTGASRVLPDVVRPFKKQQGWMIDMSYSPKTNSSPWKMMLLKDNCLPFVMVFVFRGHASIFGGCTSTTSQVEIPTPWFIEPDRSPSKNDIGVVASETAAVGLQTSPLKNPQQSCFEQKNHGGWHKKSSCPRSLHAVWSACMVGLQ